MLMGEEQQRVLIVDDEPFNVKVLVDLLRPHAGQCVLGVNEAAQRLLIQLDHFQRLALLFN